MSERQELISSAVDFLQNPQVLNAPLEKKIEFLKSKGLNEPEINTALATSNSNSNSNKNNNGISNNSNGVTSLGNNTGSNGQDGFNYTNEQLLDLAASQPPPIPERDWKDYFIMATTTISLGYGLYYLFKKVLVPTILPQSFNQLEKDKEAINEEFTRIQTLLDSLEQNNETLVANDVKNSEKLETVVSKVNNLILNSENLLNKNNDDLKLIKLEIDNLKTNYKYQNSSIENLVDTKLSNINTELESLKKLLNSRLREPSHSTVSGSSNGNGLGNNNFGSSAMKNIPSVSSIPSAADILKNVSKNTSPVPEVPASFAPSNNNTNTNNTKDVATAELTTINAPQRSESGSPGSNTSNDGNDNSNNIGKQAINRSGIPAWQLAASGNRN